MDPEPRKKPGLSKSLTNLGAPPKRPLDSFFQKVPKRSAIEEPAGAPQRKRLRTQKPLSRAASTPNLTQKSFKGVKKSKPDDEDTSVLIKRHQNRNKQEIQGLLNTSFSF